MSDPFEGNAIVYCEGAFGTTNGKTAHGLVRRCHRYRLLSVIDSRHAGRDAGAVLDGVHKGLPMCADVRSAVEEAKRGGAPATHLIIGIAPDGGRLSQRAHHDMETAIKLGLSIVSGLHDFLSEDPVIAPLAAEHGVQLIDVRKTPPRSALHAWTGKIRDVTSLKVAVLGTDSAVGKRTTAWMLVDGLREAGHSAELIGTGQTAWLQGARYAIMLDSLISDFMAGEIEHAVWSAWHDLHPEVIIVEGQGSLMNPAYPGGYEILAAARPDAVILQDAPARKEYDGFPGSPMDPIEKQIAAIELVSSKPVVAVTINHEDLSETELTAACEQIRQRTGLPVCDVLRDGPHAVIKTLEPLRIRQAVPCR
jgi:uncharacterized NAD-dependent epimerase/dehydratase family protein